MVSVGTQMRPFAQLSYPRARKSYDSSLPKVSILSYLGSIQTFLCMNSDICLGNAELFLFLINQFARLMHYVSLYNAFTPYQTT